MWAGRLKTMHYLLEVTYAHVAGAFLEVTNEMLL